MPLTEKHYHAVQFYKDETSLAGTVAQFLAEGLSTGQPGIVIATPSHTETIVRELTARGLDVAELRITGELHFFDAQKLLASFMFGGLPDPVLFRSSLGDLIEKLCAGRTSCPIRAYGEMVDLLWQEGNADGAIKVEILWNQLAATYDFALLCGYAVGHFYKETRDPRYQDVVAQHSHVMPASN
jgi:MEDS: MEthanogen/methylotroph, DcmR Sensory domain